MYRTRTRLFPRKVRTKLSFYISESERLLFCRLVKGIKRRAALSRTYAACAQRGSHAPVRGSLAAPAADA